MFGGGWWGVIWDIYMGYLYLKGLFLGYEKRLLEGFKL
jgi:hypothetical protein